MSRKRKKSLSRGYGEAGASNTKRALKGMVPSSGAPNEDIDPHNSTLRQRSRMLYMSSPIATSAINTSRTKIVGTGLVPKPSIDFERLHMTPEKARKWQSQTEAEFSLWASDKRSCDATGLNTFYSMQQLALVSWLLSGDCFALVSMERSTKFKPYGLRLHIIEADRVSTPVDAKLYGLTSVTTGETADGNPIYDGVETDANGKVVAYHVCNAYPGQITSQNKEIKWTRVKAEGARTGLPNVLHIMSSERPDQYRGVPYLAQVIEPMLQIRRYTESELMAALVQSFFTAWITTHTDPSEIPINEVGGGDAFGVPGQGEVSKDQNEYEMSPGTIVHLEEGEDIKFGNPNIPTSGFDVFLKALCREIGSALEIPYDVLMKEFNSSYSASRGALLEAWEAFKMRRSWFVDDFCQPAYEIWLTEAVARGRIKAPGFFEDPLIRAAWCKANWIGPIQGQLDPLKEANAALMLTGHGVKTHSQITRELGGGDWNNNIEQLRLENEKLAEAGRALTPVDTQKPQEGEGNAKDV